MIKIYSKHFREIAGIPFKINKIYPSYRQWFNKSTNQMEVFVQKDWEWQEKYWDWSSFQLKAWSPDFKSHKKVYDIEFILSKPKSFMFKTEEKNDNVITATLSWYMLWEMMKASVAFWQDIPQNNGRDAFDWEERYLESIVWEYLVFAVTWEGIGTKYTFKSSWPFTLPEDNVVEKSEEIKEVEKILWTQEEKEIDELF